jgi:hypothetical protein
MIKTPFQNETILLVEGDTDVVFIQALLKLIGLKDVIVTNRDPKTERPTTQERMRIHESGGSQLVKTFGEIVLDLGTQFETNQTDINLRQVVVLIDGDDTEIATQKLSTFNKHLRKARFKTELTQVNTMQQAPSFPISFGVYVLKDFTNETFKDLESLLYSLLKDEFLKNCLESYIQCAGVKEDKYIHKRKISILLPILEGFEGNAHIVLRDHFARYFKTKEDVEEGHPLTQLIALLENIKDNTPDA